MIHSAVVALATLLETTSRTPVIMQCPQSAPEPWVKWLLPTIVQTVVSLLSIGAGVAIAVCSFRGNRQTEHDQWVRDQKKAEWSCLLRGLANVYQITSFVGGWNRKILDKMILELEPALKEVSIARADCVFLDEFRLNNEGFVKITEFLRFATIQLQKLEGNLGLFDSIQGGIEKAGSATDEDNKSRLRCVEIISGEVSDLAAKSNNLLDWLQNEAALDLIRTDDGGER